MATPPSDCILLPDLAPSALLKKSHTRWPCQDPAHEFQAKAEAVTLEWFSSMGVPEKTIHKHTRARFDIVIGLGYRSLELSHYILGSKIIHLTFLIDDVLEKCRSNAVLQEIAALKNVFRGSTEDKGDSLLVRLLRR